MESNKKYLQIAKLIIMFLLLLITPLLSTSMRQPYLYFLLNILIIVVAAEAGLLSSFNKPPTHEEDNKQIKHQPAVVASPKPISTSTINTTNTAYFVETSPNIKETRRGLLSNFSPRSGHDQGNDERKVTYRTVEKSKSEKIVKAVKLVRLVKRIPSTPSLFFIGSSDCTGEADHQQEVEDPSYQLTENEGEKYQVEEIDALSGQELYSKAEMFIGNFYKQLKMQREDSWKKLHDIYHKAF
ncbi:hypothetical protein MKW98_022457 [Papaver atlanticum]|uniref:DUF4408 domain-containing protein n=1 Tax=Papaver atlanticum TaxID=357466 RepID=A0AAD4XT37_9MAGN|nr:hypothetical protein MKW98_022457 [Papaver atlanticum]